LTTKSRVYSVKQNFSGNDTLSLLPFWFFFFQLVGQPIIWLQIFMLLKMVIKDSQLGY